MDDSKTKSMSESASALSANPVHQLFDELPNAILLIDHEIKLSPVTPLCGYGRHHVLGMIPLNIAVDYKTIQGQTFTLLSVVKKEDSQAASCLHQSLSKRELQVFKLIAIGRSIKDIANDLQISEKTVATHLARLREKTGLISYVQIARYALMNGLVS